MNPATPRTSITRPRLLMAALILCGAALRLAGSRDQLWLDEIWTLGLLHTLRSPLDILTLTHDNNHVLVSLYIWMVGVDASSVTLRSLSLAAGIGSLLSACLLVRNRPAVERLLALALIALSYPLIVYCSEARGYAPAVFFALTAHVLVAHAQHARLDASLGLFWSMVFLGGLSHLTFLLLVPAWAVSFLPRAIRDRSLCTLWRDVARAFAVPVLLLAAAYWPHFARHVVGGVGGALDSGPFDVLRQWLTLVVGAPRHGPWSWGGALAVAVLLAAGIEALRREDRDEWLFLAAIIVMPLAGVAVLQPSYLLPRHLLVTVPFLLLLLARVLHRLYLRFPGVALTLAAVMLAGNIHDTARFLRVGRGHYAEVVAYIARQSTGRTSVTSDHDTRTSMLFGYYVPLLRIRQVIDYHSLAAIPPQGTDWLITHSFERDPQVPPTERRGPWRYRLVYHAPYFGELSGFHWFLYQRAGRVGAAAVFDKRGRDPL
jgi:hypothetical protein